MKSLTENEIKRSISNVKATLAVEGLHLPRHTVIDGRKYLKGELSSQQAIENITKHILRKSGK